MFSSTTLKASVEIRLDELPRETLEMIYDTFLGLANADKAGPDDIVRHALAQPASAVHAVLRRKYVVTSLDPILRPKCVYEEVENCQPEWRAHAMLVSFIVRCMDETRFMNFSCNASMIVPGPARRALELLTTEQNSPVRRIRKLLINVTAARSSPTVRIFRAVPILSSRANPFLYEFYVFLPSS